MTDSDTQTKQPLAGNNKVSQGSTGAPEKKPVAKPGLTQNDTGSNQIPQDARRESNRQNPLEMPHYDVSRDSKEYREWRETQHRHGIRNLVLSLLVFGGLAVLYLIFIHNS